MNILFPIFLIIINLSKFAKSSSLIYYYTHEEAEELKIQVGSLTSNFNPIPFKYFDLTICKPQDLLKEESDNLGDILTGEKKYNSLYSTFLKKNEYCKVLCKQKFESRHVKRFNYIFRKNYVSNWFLDGLPAALLKHNAITGKTTLDYFSGIPLAISEMSANSNGAKEIHIYNHFQFRILYHKVDENSYEIVGFNILPLSIEQSDEPKCANSSNTLNDNYNNDNIASAKRR